MNKKEIAAETARQKAFAEELAAVRPVTRHLVISVLLDQWPNHAVELDFGIESQKHYESLYYPIRNQEFSPRELDAALGNASKLTALVSDSPSNPHKDIQFETAWDRMLNEKVVVRKKPDKGMER